MRPLFARTPDSILGRPLPSRFRGWRIHLADPAVVVRELVAWVERELAGAPSSRAQERGTRGDDERAALVRALIDLLELVRSDGLRQKIRDALDAAGVVEVTVDAGTEFDPNRHHAVARADTDEERLHNTVKATARPGFTDSGRAVRLPEVEVFRLRGP